ncbi:oxidoreductase [Planomicrobium sp. Y74]|uniref:oxidoreductase n=1 Tax=Planomicrobium sp. Y74 TaxID=2478977 RepID=UPI000EF52AB4|nr:oxidoreductase [Planomicrobium sp. Y74]RLQ91518.1 SDR family NAD(P)-dependent oxidoreductase [Planomicrobium sp. Y74]
MTQQDIISKVTVITGANSGIGLEAAKVLAGKGFHIVMAVRNETKGTAARKEILALHPDAAVEVKLLDVADLASVRSFADEILRDYDALDLLINNAGVMMPPYSKTKDGFEMQFGSNHLGHFALNALLYPLLNKTPESRIVTTGSLAHNRGAIDFDNLDGSKGYKAKKFYNQSKLANMLFALELDRRLKEHGSRTISVICHPGVSATNIFKIGKKDAPLFLRNLANKYYLQPPELGALATVHAATDPGLTGGEYIGPDGPGRRKGYPALETPHPSALDEEVAKRLWQVSEELTGIKFDFGDW